MDRPLSLYLDLIRASAAFVVLLSHLGHGHLIGGHLWVFTFWGEEAVMTFFVLSGLVIAFMADGREHDLASFSAARLARLYSVILPAMLLTIILDAIGYRLAPEVYHKIDSFASTGDLLSGYATSLFMINQSWSLNLYFGTDGPYWSIPFEFWYYFLFGAAFFMRGWQRVAAVVLGALIAGPRILWLFPVWLLGVGTYWLIRHRAVAQQWGLPLFLLGGIGLLAMAVADWLSHGNGEFVGVAVNSLGWKYLFGLLFALNIIGFTGVSSRFAGVLERLATPIRASAGITFSLYLFHLPVLTFIEAASPFDQSSLVHKAVLLISPILVAFTLGGWCEKQKRPIRRALVKRFSRSQSGGAPAGGG